MTDFKEEARRLFNSVPPEFNRPAFSLNGTAASLEDLKEYVNYRTVV